MSRWLVGAGLAMTKLTKLTEPPEPPLAGQVSEVLSVKSVLSDRAKAPEAVAIPTAQASFAAAVTSVGLQSIPHDAFCHGRDMSGNPKTWTGGAVPLAAWRNLSDWERHGSTGKVWNGLTRAWDR